jgi:hypothetical protein
MDLHIHSPHIAHGVLSSLSTGTIFTVYNEGVWGSGGTAAHILNLGTSCR